MFLSVSFIEDIIMQCLGLDVYTLSSCLLPWWGKRESSLSSPLSIKWVPTPRLFSTGRMSTCSHHVCCFYSMVEYSSLGSYAPQNLGGSFFFSLLLSLVILHISVLTYLCWLVGSGLWCSFFVATTAIPPSSFFCSHQNASEQCSELSHLAAQDGLGLDLHFLSCSEEYLHGRGLIYWGQCPPFGLDPDHGT